MLNGSLFVLKMFGNLISFNRTLDRVEPQMLKFIVQGGAIAQSVERANPGEEVPGSILAVAALSLVDGSVSV